MTVVAAPVTIAPMLKVRVLSAFFLAALGFSAFTSSCSSSSAGDTCQSSCDKVAGCALVASGFTCAGDCGENGCAYCINTNSCADLKSGQCSTVCVGVNFVAK